MPRPRRSTPRLKAGPRRPRLTAIDDRRCRPGATGEAARGNARRAARRVAALGTSNLWDPLLACAEKRLKGPRHESRWFNLAGFFLRPGRGYPLDEVRIKALWPIFHQGVKHIKDVQCWAEWWILWRRVAAGLARPHHDEIYRRLAPFLLPAKGSSPAKKAGRPKPEAHEMAEMWRVRGQSRATWRPTSRNRSATLSSRSLLRVRRAPMSTGAWVVSVPACRSTGRRIRSF